MNDVGVLGAVQPVHGADSSRLGMRRPRLIDLALDRRRDRPVRGGIGTRPPRRRHRLRAQLADHALPDFRIRARVRGVECIECESGGAESLVMAGDAVLIDERLWRGWRCRGGTLRLTRPDLDARDGYSNPAADEERQDRGESPHRPPDPLMSRANCASATVHCHGLLRLLPTSCPAPFPSFRSRD